MFEVALSLRRTRDGRTVLALSPTFRLGLLGLLALLVAGMASTGAFTAPVPLILMAVLALGSLYEERWTIDPDRRGVESRHGLLFLARVRRWSFDEIAAVEYSHYAAGSMPGSGPPADTGTDGISGMKRGAAGRMAQAMQRQFLAYSLVFVDGTSRRIEVRRVHSISVEGTLPRAVAGAIGVPLHERSI